MPFQYPVAAQGRVPDPNCRVFGTRRKLPSVRREGHHTNRVFMALKRLMAACDRIPNLDCLVSRA